MPAIVGAVKVVTVASSAIFNIGDVYAMCPESSAKTYAGGGSFNTGDGNSIHLVKSNTIVDDPDNLDQNILE